MPSKPKRKTNLEAKGFLAAIKAIKSDGGSKEAAKRQLGVACGDLDPNDFTKGWKQACDELIGSLS